MGRKIGLVSGEFPPMEGGVGAFTRELAKALSTLGHEIHIVTSHQARPEKSHRSFWEPKEPIDLDFAFLHPIIHRWWWAANGSIARVAIENDLEIINLQYQAAAYSMYVPAINILPWRLKGLTSSIVTFHDLRFPYLFPKSGRLRPAVVKALAKMAQGVIVTNGEDLRQVTAYGIPGEQLAQIPIGSNIKASTPTMEVIRQVRSNFGLRDGDQLLGYFGFVNESKGADQIVKVLNDLDPRIHLLFIGAQTGSSDSKNNQEFLDSLLTLINKANLQERIHWSGFLNDEDVSACMHAVDLMVLPYQDGISLRRGTLMATLAHGRPLVSTLPELPIPPLKHGHNVWLVKVDDSLALKDAIERLLEDAELRSRLGREAGITARSFSWDTIAANTISFYETIIHREATQSIG